MEITHHQTYMHATKTIYFRILNLKHNLKNTTLLQLKAFRKSNLIRSESSSLKWNWLPNKGSKCRLFGSSPPQFTKYHVRQTRQGHLHLRLLIRAKNQNQLFRVLILHRSYSFTCTSSTTIKGTQLLQFYSMYLPAFSSYTRHRSVYSI